jgi:hypothetical protein
VPGSGRPGALRKNAIDYMPREIKRGVLSFRKARTQLKRRESKISKLRKKQGSQKGGKEMQIR